VTLPLLPELAAAVRRLPAGTVVDGEIVIWAGERTDFALLQQRVLGHRPVPAANLVCFDVLQHPTEGVVIARPLSARRRMIEDLLAGTGPELTQCPQTTPFVQAEEW